MEEQKRRELEEYEEEAARLQASVPYQLRVLNEQMQKGILTLEEYQEKKTEILAKAVEEL